MTYYLYTSFHRCMQLSFHVARAYNLAAGIGRFMFPMLPVIPDDLMAHGSKLMRSLKEGKGSADDFACIKVEPVDRRVRAVCVLPLLHL